MDAVLTEWLSLCLRWLHMVAGMAWIGASFYFIRLDLSLRADPAIAQGVQGEAWEVHGGGFYRIAKYSVAPARMPEELAWFKWEAYTTWLSGFALLVVTYYIGAELFLIDRSVLDLTPGQAIGVSLGTLLAAWLAYEGLCRSPLGEREYLLAGIGFLFLVALFWGFSHVFSGRGTFIQMGAIIGTMMVANVFVVIIPNQKKMVASLIAGQAPEARLGIAGKQRSVHNNYLTLPVVFLMIGNHYPLMFATRYSLIIFAIVLAIGFLVRHFYNLRHAGKPNPWWTWAAAAVGMACVAWLSWTGARIAPSAALPAASFAQAQDVVLSRCSMCHSAAPVWEGFVTAPRHVLLDTPENIRAHAREIEIYAVLTNAMPPDNVTKISDDERRILAAGLAPLVAPTLRSR
ncbi:MAG TPA: urate hydroxylase PuuD [Stellaceae bacterium]|nr:urate hydroxylase PuuD [Stellaceae bacterium]